MSLKLARSMDTGEIVSSIKVFDESISDKANIQFKDSHNFSCLDEECNIQLTLVNFGNKNRIMSPFFKPSHHTGHSENCIMIRGSGSEIRNLLSKLDPKLSHETLSHLSKDANEHQSIIDTVPKRRTLTSSNSQDPSNLDQQYIKSDVKNNPSKKGFRKSTISSLGSVFTLFKEKPDSVEASINWPSYRADGTRLGFSDDLVKNSPFKLEEIVKEIKSNNVPLNVTAIYFTKAWVNFSEGDTKSEPLAVSFKTLYGNISTYKILWNKLRGFTNINLLRNRFERRSNRPIEIVLCGHFYRYKNGKIIFMPRASEVRKWLFIPDQN
ncbi:hypothetical protein ACHLJU_03110 [Pediococcus acidilactici]|uniref:hypothetical protein n=1 Tax=Pediococcus acidilactici TaxID=1254 RepID=UPI003A8CDA2E